MSKNLRRAAILSLAIVAGGFIGQAAQADPVSTTGRNSQGSSVVTYAQSEVGYVTYTAGATAGRAVYTARRTLDDCGACQGLTGGGLPQPPPPPAPVIPAPVQNILDMVQVSIRR